jgi:hypothetical protein
VLRFELPRGAALPAGLQLDEADGAIFGTPTAACDVTVPVDAVYEEGVVRCGARCIVERGEPAPAVAYPEAVLAVGVPARAIEPSTSAGGPVDSFQLEGALPAGLVLDEVTGVVSGTPVAPAAADVPVLCSGPGGSSQAVLRVSAAWQAPALSLDATRLQLRQGVPITPFRPRARGSPADRFEAAGLPAGLAVDPRTGEVSGRPLAACPEGPARLTAVNAGGSGWVDFSVTVLPAAPAIAYPPLHLVAGRRIEVVPTNAGGPVDAFSVDETALPDGLIFALRSGTISGAPSAAHRPHEVEITAANAGGISTARVLVEVVPTLDASYPDMPERLARGQPFGPLPVAVHGSPAGQFRAEVLPPGVSAGPDGALGGVPTEDWDGEAVVTAVQDGARRPLFFRARVGPALPAVSYDLPRLVVGEAMVPVLPRVSGELPVLRFLAVDGAALPPGLAVDQRSGAISGTPAVPGEFTSVVLAEHAEGALRCALSFAVDEPAPLALAPVVKYPELELHLGVSLGAVSPDTTEGGPVRARAARAVPCACVRALSRAARADCADFALLAGGRAAARRHRDQRAHRRSVGPAHARHAAHQGAC